MGQALLLSVLTHLVVVSGQNDNADGEHLTLVIPSDPCNLSQLSCTGSFTGVVASLQLCEI